MLKSIVVVAVIAACLSASVVSAQRSTWQILQNTSGTGDGGELVIQDGSNSIGLTVEMSASGTVVFEVKGEGGTYRALTCVNLGDTAGALISSASASMNVQCATGTMSTVRARVTSNGGTIVVRARVSDIVARGGGSGGGGGGSFDGILKDGTGDTTQANVIAGRLQVDLPSSASTGGVNGQVAVGTSSTAFASNAVQEVCIKALHTNTINVRVGWSPVTTSSGIELAPGEGWCTRAANTNLLASIAASTGASVSFSGRN